jgi:hypothetical protein
MILVFEHIGDIVVGKAVGLGGVLFEDAAIAGGRVHPVETAAFRPDPVMAGPVQRDTIDKIIGKAVRLAWIMAKVRKAVFILVQAVNPSTPGADPDIALGILGKAPDIIIGQAGGILRVIAENNELVAIPTVEPILCAKPKESGLILEDTGDIALGQAIIGTEMGEFDRDRLGKRAQRQAKNQ